MRQPAFRLEPVLRLRRTQERAASLAAAQSAREATAAARRAEDGAAALAGTPMPALSTSSTFVAAMVASRAAAADVSAARSLAVSYAEQADAVRAQWTAAAQRTKGLERLKQRHVERLQSAVDAAEARLVDDLVTRRPAGDRHPGEEETWTD